MRARFLGSLTHSKATLETRLAGKFPGLVLERKINPTYEALNVADSKRRQLLVFAGELSQDTTPALVHQLPVIQLMSKELSLALEKEDIDLRLVVTGYQDVLVGLWDCLQATTQCQLAVPLHYVRRIPKESSASVNCKITEFQDHSFIVGPDRYIEAVVDHREHPKVLERCDHIASLVLEPKNTLEHS